MSTKGTDQYTALIDAWVELGCPGTRSEFYDAFFNGTGLTKDNLRSRQRNSALIVNRFGGDWEEYSKSRGTFDDRLAALQRVEQWANSLTAKEDIYTPPLTPKEKLVADIRNFVIQANSTMTISHICETFDVGPHTVREILRAAESQNYLVSLDKEAQTVSGGLTVATGRRRLLVNERLTGYKIQFGVVSDIHIGSKHANVTALAAMYDIFKERGITTVFDTGNWVDGFVARVNGTDVTHHLVPEQIDEWIRLMPSVEGLTTYFIAGDDHEGWFQRDSGLEVGAFAQSRAREAGREDLKYLGWVEYDYVFTNPDNGNTIVKLMHPGGGSAYAVSYRPQKIVESIAQKGMAAIPHVLLIGHFHKANYMYWQGCHVIQSGCFQEQTTFMRKKQLSAHVGAWIVTLTVNAKGDIVTIVPEFFPMGQDSNGSVAIETETGDAVPMT